jgi:GTPase SAR1 family protein
MKLPEKMTSGRVDVAQIRWLLYGPPKIGKTALASGFPNVIFLATEKGYKALRLYKEDILSWEDYIDAVDTLTKKKHKFETATVDTVDMLFDKCVEYCNEKLGIEHESDAEWGKGWAAVRREFLRVNNRLFQSDLGIIFISHMKADKITTEMTEITKMVPTLPNQARKIVLPLVDTIGLMRYKTKKVGKGEYEDRLIIDFKPSPNIETGDRTGLLPPELKLEVIPEEKRRTPEIVAAYAKKNYERIAKYYS